jgi:hypothetical protein
VLRNPRNPLLIAIALATVVAALIAAPVAAANARTAVGLNATRIAGFPTGAVALTGGGVVDTAAGTGHLNGSFDILADIHQGPLNGGLAGEGVRWDTVDPLRSTSFKCTGAATEALKPISIDPSTIILQADFYRAGDGNDESFSAQMIVADHDIAPDVLGFQNVWVQGVGCGAAGVNLHAG